MDMVCRDIELMDTTWEDVSHGKGQRRIEEMNYPLCKSRNGLKSKVRSNACM